MDKNGHSFLYLIWKDPSSRRNYIIGILEKKKSGYSFEYGKDYKLAKGQGWELLSAFPEDKVYFCEHLFAAFTARLPDPKRKDISEILQKYGLDHYDGYELLKVTTGRLPIDTYEFIDPIFPDDTTIVRDFYLMGIRHHGNCEGIDCTKLHHLSVGEELEFLREPDNKSDPYAIKVMHQDGTMLGYVPRYYSESVTQRLNKGMTYSCIILEVQLEGHCENCIKVRMRMPKE